MKETREEDLSRASGGNGSSNARQARSLEDKFPYGVHVRSFSKPELGTGVSYGAVASDSIMIRVSFDGKERYLPSMDLYKVDN